MKANVSQWIGARSSQEDVYRIRFFPEGLLVLVCDGMGGHYRGAEAAAGAADAFVDFFATSSSLPMSERLHAALNAANAAVGKLMKRHAQEGGTTLVAGFIGSGVVRWISVGDSSLLLWRRGRLIRLNADHSLRPVLENALPGKGRLSHMLRSALMGGEIAMVDAPPTPMPLLPGDRLIVCSDGADELLNPGGVPVEVAALLSECGDNDAAALIALLCQQGNPTADNATVIVVDV